MNSMTFFFVGCLVGLCSSAPSPICQWNSRARTSSSPSIHLRYKGNEFPDMEEGRIPAWVGSDGLMRVPSALPYLTSSDHSDDSIPGVLSPKRTNNSPYGLVVLPGISTFQTDSNAFEGSNDEEEVVEEEESSFSRRLLKFAPLLPKSESQTTADYYNFESFLSTDDQDGSFAGVLVPSVTHADGSDIFGFETYSTKNHLFLNS